MPVHLPPTYLIPLLGLLLVVCLAAASFGWVRRLVQLAFWGLALWLLATVLGTRGEFEPAVGRLTGWFTGPAQSVSGHEVRVKLSPDGHYWVQARLNGVSRRLLVDSGATVTALSTETAEAAGLEVAAPLVPVLLRTANGTVRADTATVATLRFGTIVARDLPVVVSPAFGGTDVLGMNFLSKLKGWRVEDGILVLEPHHPQPATG